MLLHLTGRHRTGMFFTLKQVFQFVNWKKFISRTPYFAVPSVSVCELEEGRVIPFLIYVQRPANAGFEQSFLYLISSRDQQG